MFTGECFFTNLTIVTLISPQEREVNWFYKLLQVILFLIHVCSKN